jgi:hypothetical protein
MKIFELHNLPNESRGRRMLREHNNNKAGGESRFHGGESNQSAERRKSSILAISHRPPNAFFDDCHLGRHARCNGKFRRRLDLERWSMSASQTFATSPLSIAQ